MYSGFGSADYEQREKEKTRIEKAYRESDRRIGELVTGKCCSQCHKYFLHLYTCVFVVKG